MTELNPYQAPEAGTGRDEPPPDTISPTRYVVNVGCGVEVLLVWIPGTFMLAYQLVLERTVSGLLGLGVNALFLWGCIRSISWAIKRRRRQRLTPRVMPGTSEADKEHRRMYGY